MGNIASSQGSSTGTHDGDVGSSISEEQHDWPIEQAADTPDVGPTIAAGDAKTLQWRPTRGTRRARHARPEPEKVGEKR